MCERMGTKIMIVRGLKLPWRGEVVSGFQEGGGKRELTRR